jgi:hypothetical protein
VMKGVILRVFIIYHALFALSPSNFDCITL